jgi:Cu2+-exporting ATPase
MEAFYRERTNKPGAAPISNPSAIFGEGVFALDRVQSEYVSASGNLRSAEIYVEGITCSACVWLAESALKRLPGVTDAGVNQVTHRASVTWDALQTGLPEVLQSLQSVGLAGQPASAGAALAQRRSSRRRSLIELGVALLSMMQVMMFTVPLYLSDAGDITAEAKLLMNWAAMVLTLPAILYSGRSFFTGAWRDLRILKLRRVTMDLPIALAIIAGFLSSVVALVAGEGDTYFDSISMFIFLLLSARYLESSARDSSLALIERLTNAMPALAWRLVAFPMDQQGVTVPASELQPGDVVRIATGEMAAADGTIVQGVSEFDESLLSGESSPVPRRAGDSIMGGSLNLGSPILMRVTHASAHSAAAILRKLTEQAMAARPLLVQLADRIAQWIAPLTLLAAFGAALAWLAFDPARSLPVAVAVLAVTCPCALALAAPAAQALATSRLAREGLLITRPGALERIAGADHIVFDKTGTLTHGEISIEGIDLLATASRDEVLAIAVAIEHGSVHPIARALARARSNAGDAVPLPAITNSTSVPGAGVECRTGGSIYRLGTQAYVAAIAGTAPALSADASLFLGGDHGWLAAMTTDDALRPDAATTTTRLRATGLETHLLSGDRIDRVARIGQMLQFAPQCVVGACLPASKLAYAEQLSNDGAGVIAIGDGINDAPMLGKAHVSIAMGRGADLTRLTADAVLMSSQLTPLVTARLVAAKMNRIIRQNFAWAIAYNLIAVPLAMGGCLSPAWAAVGMAGSSLIVVGNSMRLLRNRAA